MANDAHSNPSTNLCGSDSEDVLNFMAEVRIPTVVQLDCRDSFGWDWDESTDSDKLLQEIDIESVFLEKGGDYANPHPDFLDITPEKTATLQGLSPNAVQVLMENNPLHLSQGRSATPDPGPDEMGVICPDSDEESKNDNLTNDFAIPPTPEDRNDGFSDSSSDVIADSQEDGAPSETSMALQCETSQDLDRSLKIEEMEQIANEGLSEDQIQLLVENHRCLRRPFGQLWVSETSRIVTVSTLALLHHIENNSNSTLDFSIDDSVQTLGNTHDVVKLMNANEPDLSTLCNPQEDEPVQTIDDTRDPVKPINRNNPDPTIGRNPQEEEAVNVVDEQFQTTKDTCHTVKTINTDDPEPTIGCNPQDVQATKDECSTDKPIDTNDFPNQDASERSAEIQAPFETESMERRKKSQASEKPRKKADNGTLKCDVCGKQLTTSFGLKQHMRTHTGERPFKCDTCEGSFARKSSLKDHMRIHTGEKPYVCETCSKCFRQAAHLIEHAKVHKEKKMYKCQTCEKVFTHKTNLRRHERIHSGEKRYSCRICGKVFIQSNNLLAHLETHTDDQ